MNLGRIFRGFVPLLVAGSLWSCAGWAEDAPLAVPAPAATGYLDALDWAFKFASAIPQKTHGSDRGTCQYNALTAYIDMGAVDEAIRRVPEMTGYRQGQVYAAIAGALAASPVAKDRDRMAEFLERAREARGKIPEGAQADWQKDRVSTAIAVTQAKAGLFEEARTTAALVGPAANILVKIEELGRIADDADYAATVKEMQTMGNSTETAMVGARILDNHAKNLAAERLAEIAGLLVTAAAQTPVPMYGSVRIDAGRALLAAGRREQGLRVLDETHQEMISKGLNPRLDVPGLVQMAKVCDELGGDPQRAEALLVEVGDLLGRPDLERDDRVRGTIALAAGYAAHKDSETAWKHFRAALTGARDQGNGRPRHMMLTDLCVAIGRCRYSLPADVSRALEQEWKRQGPPW